MTAIAKDAIELLQRSGACRSQPFVLHVPGLPAHQVYVWKPEANNEGSYGGDLELVTLDPKPIDYRASTVQGFIEAVKRAYKANEPTNSNMAVYVNNGKALCWLDESKRRDKIVLSLTYSPPFKSLTDGTLRSTDQRTLVRTLRTLFNGNVTPDTFLSNARNLKFTQNAEGDSDIQHGKESLGKAVLKKVTGATDIAEEITLSGQVFEEVDFTGGIFKVLMVVDINVEDCVFTLIPIAGEVFRAKQEADEAVAREIREALKDSGLGDKIAVVCGCSGE